MVGEVVTLDVHGLDPDLVDDGRCGGQPRHDRISGCRMRKRARSRKAGGRKDISDERPSLIRFTQRRVSSRFRNGQPLAELACRIAQCIVRVNDIKMIRIVYHEGHWFSLDNRRLAVFRLLEFTGLIRSIPVKRIMQPVIEWNRKFDTLSFWCNGSCPRTEVDHRSVRG